MSLLLAFQGPPTLQVEDEYDAIMRFSVPYGHTLALFTATDWFRLVTATGVVTQAAQNVAARAATLYGSQAVTQGAEAVAAQATIGGVPTPPAPTLTIGGDAGRTKKRPSEEWLLYLPEDEYD